MNRKGFALIELLIVIGIIGILAAVAVVTYVQLEDRAHDAAANSAMGSLRSSLEIYKVNPQGGNGAYPANLGSGFDDSYISIDQVNASFNSLSYARTSDTAYLISAQSKSGKTVTVTVGTVSPIF